MEKSPLSNEQVEIYLSEYKELNSLIFKESLASFEVLKNKELVLDVLKKQISPNENIIYARLIMSTEAYKSLWEDNIKEMSLQRIHRLAHDFIYANAQKIHTVPSHILVNTKVTMTSISTFLVIRDIFSANPELVSMLENEYWNLASPVFKKSLASFESLKNKEFISDILEEQISSNENVIYARLIMIPEVYNTLWEDNIKKMSLERIHRLTRDFIKKEAQKLHTVPIHILVNEDIAMTEISTFLKIRDIISENPILVSVLENETWLNKQSSEHSIDFSYLILSNIKREAIWEKAIMSENMSPERMYTIEKRLNIEKINELWTCISHKNMTIDKIILIGEMLSIDDIRDFWAEKLTQISIADLQMELYT